MPELKERKNTAIGGKKTPKKSRLEKLHEFDFSINKENAPRILPFILFIAFWAILYIANRSYGEKTVREIDKLNNSLKDLKADYDTYNAELSHRSTQTEVAERVAPLGLKELRTPPKRLKISPEDER
ncbi:MAG: FtsL-like putative cell division protein [Bacteroidota bacterium]|nr:FtsL-like putative cell division protein [Bacteroidota bacterium]